MTKPQVVETTVTLKITVLHDGKNSIEDLAEVVSNFIFGEVAEERATVEDDIEQGDYGYGVIGVESTHTTPLSSFEEVKASFEEFKEKRN